MNFYPTRELSEKQLKQAEKLGYHYKLLRSNVDGTFFVQELHYTSKRDAMKKFCSKKDLLLKVYDDGHIVHASGPFQGSLYYVPNI